MVLGGSSGSGGGSGGPPGGFVGKLIQTNICYDTTEASASSGSTSLLDNLNHIRYDISQLGDVKGPGSSTDNAIVRWDGTSGSVVQNSNVTVDDSGNIATSGTVDGVDVSDLATAYFYTSQASGELSNEIVVRVIDDGNLNVFVGAGSGAALAGGMFNAGLGYSAGAGITSGEGNALLGFGGGGALTMGDYNTALGAAALFAATTGSFNTAVGELSLYSLTTGSKNTVVGGEAGYNLTSGSGNVFLGYQAGYNEAGSNKLYIENSSGSTPLIYGEFDNDILRFYANVGIGTSPSYPLHIKNDGNSPQLALYGDELWTFQDGSLGTLTIQSQSIFSRYIVLQNPSGNFALKVYGGVEAGVNSTTRGTLTLWDGAGGNTPGYALIYSPNGTGWYLFVEDDGTVKIHNAIPTQNADGSVIGAQT